MKRTAAFVVSAMSASCLASDAPVWTNSSGMRFIEVPAGIAELGSAPDEKGRNNDERRRKERIERPFLLGATEVTQAQWTAVMGANPSSHRGRSLPVEMVTWNEANEFCRRLSEKDGRKYRLPREAEWESACRASRKGPLLDELSKRAWTLSNARDTMPVAQLSPNPWGFFDMQGNVAEWCSDTYTDAKGNTDKRRRIVKGGAFSYAPLDARPAWRLGLQSATGGAMRAFFVGFRVVCETSKSSAR
jgi:formylglycine-generating enzyme required for sulfatase activity